MISLFENTAFFASAGTEDTPRRRLVRWNSKIVVAVAGKATSSQMQFLEEFSQNLSKLTGREVTVSLKSGDYANVILEFGPQRLMAAAAVRNGMSAWHVKHVEEQAECMALPKIRRSVLYRAFIYIPNDKSDRVMRACIVEELTQSLGLMGDTNVVKRSIFRTDDDRDSLSIADMIVLRTLYDPEIWSGMPKRDAMSVARRIIPRLLDAYRARGMSALYQPAL